MYIIEPGKPPAKTARKNAGRPSKYNFGSMGVGTVMTIPANDPAAKKVRYGKSKTVTIRAKQSAYSYARKNNVIFEFDTPPSGEFKIYRVA